MLSVPSIPLEWWAQFRLEARFGFNTTTLGTWMMDRVKGMMLAAVLGLPLLALILKLVEWMGALWWLWAWATLMGFQVLILFLAPVWIMPLFNKFTPLPEGSLRERLLGLGEKTGFNARTIQVMDGSRRSRHANAFFTGFGRFRKIVLYDTLITQLSEEELEAVLAHEIGHHRRRHILQRLAWSSVTSLAGFWVVGWLAARPGFAGAFGFGPDVGVAPSLLLFGLLSSPVLFWFSPLGNYWSRRHEYEADAYAKAAVGSAAPLMGALRKLSEKNLANLTPHPWYSTFHYSHPTLVEREAALRS
jgi:STE24 endopeptidase